jgi:hypothetical protein
MGYILKKSTGGGGNATAANQQKQIDQLAEISGYPSVLKDKVDESVFIQNQDSVFVGDRTVGNDYGVFKNSSNKSIFKEGSTNRGVFTEITGKSTFNADSDDSLLFKSIVNNFNSLSPGRPNNVVCQYFTDVTAAGVAGLLNGFLNATPCYIISLTSSQGAGTHDLFLLYSPL